MKLRKRLEKLSAKIRKNTESTKLNFFRNIFHKKNDTKSHWKHISNLTGKVKNSISIQSIISDNGLTKDTKKIADVLNNFFVGVSNTNWTNSTHTSDNSFDLPINKHNIFLAPINSYEIIKIIQNLKDTHSAGLDGISNFCLKKITFNIADILCYIFNISFSEGCFPNLLKQAVVIPLHKQGDKTQPNNYRPISLLSVFSKILEKIMKSRMLNFIKKFNILSNNQYGFRENCNTEDALLTVLNRVYSNMNNSKSVGILFLDISKAFDMVNHKILLNHLWRCGFRGECYT